MFERYVGVDYSGAQTPESSLKGLRVYVSDRKGPPREIPPPPSPRKYWTRQELAIWLGDLLAEETPTLAGLDHGFSFPSRYFLKYDLPWDWTAFLEDFLMHWPTASAHTYVDFVRDGLTGFGWARTGDRKWRRVVEEYAKAKSVFHFDVQGSVAKSTHAGLPWLLHIRLRPGSRLHFWPFDGWRVPPGRSAIAEIYPSLWMKQFPREGRDNDQQAAYVACEWMRRADAEGTLGAYLEPELTASDRKLAEVEGWILGVTGPRP